MLLSPITSIFPLWPRVPAAPDCASPISLLSPETIITPFAPYNEVVVLFNTTVLLLPVTSIVLVLFPVVSMVREFISPLALALIVASPQPPMPPAPQRTATSFRLPSTTLVTEVWFPFVWISNTPVFTAPICCISTVRLPPLKIALDETVPMTLVDPCCRIPTIAPSPTCSI